MKAVDAQAIPLRHVLNKIGLAPIHSEGDILIYLWPESISTWLTINLRHNTWLTSPEGTNGGVAEFISWYLKEQGHTSTKADVSRWLQNMFPANNVINVVHDASELPLVRNQFTVMTHATLSHPGLIRHLQKLQINPVLMHPVLKQLRIRNNQTKKIFTAAGIANEDGGFAFFNPVDAGLIHPLTISFIRGTVPKPDGIHLFYSLQDYLAALTHYRNPFEEDAMILHRYSCMKEATAYISGYGYHYACTWFPNANLGMQATHSFADFFKSQPSLLHRPMNHLYTGFTDVHQWHAVHAGLKL